MSIELSPPPGNCCVNCTMELTDWTGAVSEIHIFSTTNEFERSITLIDALASVFTAKGLMKAQELNFRLLMCPKCAEVVSGLYKEYLSLLQLSSSAAYISGLITQISTWHEFHEPGGEIQLVEDYGDEEQITVLFDEGDGMSPSGRSSSPEKKLSLKERYKIKAAAHKKLKVKKRKGAGAGSDKGPKIVRPGAEGDAPVTKKWARYQCRFIYKPQFLTCKSCPESFSYNWKLREHHLMAHEGRAQEACLNCGFMFYSEIIKPESHVCITDEHLYPKTKQGRAKKVMCKICGVRWRAERALLFHQEKVHVQDNIKFKCIHCERQAADRMKLLMHMDTHSEVKQYVCNECGVGFAQKRGLNRHIQAQHEPNIPCEVCGKMYKTRISLARHIRESHRPTMKLETADGTGTEVVFLEAFPCEHCGKVYGSKHRVMQHIRYMHTGDLYRKHICEVCGKKEPSKDKLTRHMRSHLTKEEFEKLPEEEKTRFKQRRRPETERGEFPCEVCGKMFTCRKNLWQHKRYNHEGKRPTYKCDICEKQVYHLKRHMESHTRATIGADGEPIQPKKPRPEREPGEHPCDLCGGMFSCRRNLLEHRKRIHLGKKRPLSTCGACHREVRDLKKHMLIHAKPKPKQKPSSFGRPRRPVVKLEEESSESGIGTTDRPTIGVGPWAGRKRSRVIRRPARYVQASDTESESDHEEPGPSIAKLGLGLVPVADVKPPLPPEEDSRVSLEEEPLEVPTEEDEPIIIIADDVQIEGALIAERMRRSGRRAALK